MLTGIDVYEDSPAVDFAALKSAGDTFAIAKATEGATYHDSKFVAHYAAIKAAGLIRGAYNYARPKTSTAVEEAQAFAEVVNAEGGFELPPVLDLEDTDTGLTAAEMQAYALAWAKAMQEYAGYPKQILYSNPSFINEYGLNTAEIKDAFVLWIANYADKPDLAGWDAYTFWQNTNKKSVLGGVVDGNVFNGTETDIQALCGVKPAALKTTSKASANDSFAGVTYTIAKGDSFWSVCLRYHIPLKILERYNGSTAKTVLSVGDELKIPRAYRVKAGDVLSKVFPDNWQQVATWNAINPNVIWAGQTLYY